MSEDLNQYTYMVPGQLHAQEEGISISVDVKGGDKEGQGCVDDSEGKTENSQEAFADVVTLEKHEGPVEQTFSCQTEKDGGDRDVHDVELLTGSAPGTVSHFGDSAAKDTLTCRLQGSSH